MTHTHIWHTLTYNTHSHITYTHIWHTLTYSTLLLTQYMQQTHHIAPYVFHDRYIAPYVLHTLTYDTHSHTTPYLSRNTCNRRITSHPTYSTNLPYHPPFFTQQPPLAYSTSTNTLLQLWVSFAEHSLFYRALLPKRPIILRSLLIVATP